MADSKITALQNLTAADPVNDMLPIVDVSDTTMAASGTTKRISVNNILGASGTATLASATITGAATVGTTLGVTGASTLTGNVGVGVTPSAATQTTIQVGAKTTLSHLAFGNGYTVLANNYIYNGGDKYIANGFATNHTQFDGAFYWYLGPSGTAGNAITLSQALTLTTAGNLLVGVTSANANGGVLQLKSGITFPATQVAASDANTLDDYEEGTWVGTLKGGTTDPTTPVTATGRYTKIGRVVTVQIAFENANTTGASGTVFISGLPFTNIAAIRAMGSVGVFQNVAFTETLGCLIGQSDTTISLFSFRSATGYTAATHSATTDGYIWANVTYTV